MFKQFINENKMLFLFFTASLIINIILFLIIAYPLHSQSKEIIREIEDLVLENERLKNEWIEKGKQAYYLESTIEVLNDIESSIPYKEGGLEAFIAQIERWNRELDLNVFDINLSYDRMENDILKVSTNLRLKSNYEKLKRLLYYMETYENVLLIDSLTITESPDDTIDMTIGLSAYFYEEGVYEP